MIPGGLSPKVIGEDLGHAGGDPFPGRDVEELIGTVGIGFRPQHTGDQKLHPGKALTQHAHKRNAATGAHIHGRCAKKRA